MSDFEEFPIELKPRDPSVTIEKFTPEPATFDAEHGVMEGEPWVTDDHGNVMFDVPETPHVFHARHSLYSGEAYVDAPGTPKILMAHGYPAEDGTWVFTDGRSVRSVVESYNMTDQDDPIRYLVVCNQNGDVDNEPIEGAWHPQGTKIKVSMGHDAQEGTTVITELQRISQETMHVPEGFLDTLMSDMSAKRQ